MKLNPLSGLTDLFVQNVAKKFLSSLVKGLLALAIALLSSWAAVAANLDVMAILAAHGAKLPEALVLPAWGAFLVLLKALVSAAIRAQNFDITKALGK